MGPEKITFLQLWVIDIQSNIDYVMRNTLVRNIQRNRKRKQYCAEALENAVSEARRTGKIRRAAKHYEVPFSTVQRYIKTPPKNQKPGPLTLLRPDEEARFEQWIIYMSKAGFPISETDLTHAVKDYADKIRPTRNLPSSFPSKFHN